MIVLMLDLGTGQRRQLCGVPGICIICTWLRVSFVPYFCNRRACMHACLCSRIYGVGGGNLPQAFAREFKHTPLVEAWEGMIWMQACFLAYICQRTNQLWSFLLYYQPRLRHNCYAFAVACRCSSLSQTQEKIKTNMWRLRNRWEGEDHG